MSGQPETTVDLNIDLPDISADSISRQAQSLYDYALATAIQPAVWVTLCAFIGGLVLGSFIRKITRERIHTRIDTLNVSYRTNQTLKNIVKLLKPLTALITLGMVQAAATALYPAIDLSLASALSKLLIAWIFIRIAAQIIENSFIRQIVAMFAWIVAALSILGILDETKNALDAVGMNFGDWRLSLLTLTKFTLALFILLTVTRLLANTVERNLQNTTDLTPSVRVLLIKIIKVILVSLAILIGVTSAGIDLSALAIFGGALGLGIGFGLQKVISNLFSGMLLLLDKSIKPGDVVELPGGTGAFGWVSQLGARYVSIVTRDNKEYLIPNEDFITQPVINWSYTDRKIRVETKFGVDYTSDPHRVKVLAIEAASGVKRVVSDPKPVCHLVEFSDSSLNFVLRYWIEDAENGVTNTKGDVMLALWDIFKENNIAIPFPHRVIIDKRS